MEAIRKSWKAFVARGLALNLRHPRNNPFGWRVVKNMRERNIILECNAARLCNIQPDDSVLEVGFGSGLGLKAAHDYVKGGAGRVYGIEISSMMLKEATNMLHAEILAGQVHLTQGSAYKLPYPDELFNSIFHCNVYYFWADLGPPCLELHRVLKPGGMMVSTMTMDKLREMMKQGFLQCGDVDPERYMAALKEIGFIDIHLHELTERGRKYQAILATKK